MVTTRIIYFFFLVSFLTSTCIAAQSINKPQLILFTDKDKSILGRPIRAELYGISLKTKITDINLTELNHKFGIVTDYVIKDFTDERWPNQSVQVLKLKLYPKIIGDVIIPSLSADSVNSKSIKIHIDTDQTGIPNLRISTKQPYQRQQFIAKINIMTPESNARLAIKDESAINGFESKPLLFTREKENNGHYRLSIGWALTALKDGMHKLQLPAVEYSIDGVSRKQYFFPDQSMKIRKLPSYLPPTIPVGKISIQTQISPGWLLQTDSISYWTLKLRGNVNNSYRLPPILRQIKSNRNVKVFPVDSDYSDKVTNNSFESLVEHSIPFKALNSGLIKLPDLRLQYFDPDTGTIKAITYHQHTVLALSLSWLLVLALLIFITLFYLSKICFKKWSKLKYSKQQRKLAITLLKENKSTGSIRESIRHLSKAEDWPENLALQQWAKLWMSRYKTEADFNDFIIRLSAFLYSSHTDNNSKELSNRLLLLITDRKKR